MTYEYGGITFTSKEAVIEHARSIWERSDLSVPLTASDDQFVRDLAHGHPDAANKVGPGIAQTWVVEDRWQGRGKVHRRFDIERVDGTRIDIGVAASLCPVERQPKTRTLRVLREAIDADAAAVKDRSRDYERCSITGLLVKRRDAHAHHDGTPFSKLVDAFLETEGLTFETFPVTLVDGQVQCADPELIIRWQFFHNERAILRLASAAANTRASDREIPVPELRDLFERIDGIADQMTAEPCPKQRQMMRSAAIEAVCEPELELRRRRERLQKQLQWLEANPLHPNYPDREGTFHESFRQFAKMTGRIRPDKWVSTLGWSDVLTLLPDISTGTDQ